MESAAITRTVDTMESSAWSFLMSLAAPAKSCGDVATMIDHAVLGPTLTATDLDAGCLVWRTSFRHSGSTGIGITGLLAESLA